MHIEFVSLLIDIKYALWVWEWVIENKSQNLVKMLFELASTKRSLVPARLLTVCLKYLIIVGLISNDASTMV